jgi:hypothetical protein
LHGDYFATERCSTGNAYVAPRCCFCIAYVLTERKQAENAAVRRSLQAPSWIDPNCYF